MINIFRKKKPKEENLTEIFNKMDELRKKLYLENQKMIDDYYKERK